MFIKKIFIMSQLLYIFALFGCSNPEAEIEINRLTIENAELVSQVQTLQETLDSLMARTVAVKESLRELDMNR